MLKSEILATMRNSFVKRYAPYKDGEQDEFREIAEFEIDLDRLIYAAFAAAQEPYVRELNNFRDVSVQQNQLSPTRLILSYPKDTR